MWLCPILGRDTVNKHKFTVEKFNSNWIKFVLWWKYYTLVLPVVFHGKLCQTEKKDRRQQNWNSQLWTKNCTNFTYNIYFSKSLAKKVITCNVDQNWHWPFPASLYSIQSFIHPDQLSPITMVNVHVKCESDTAMYKQKYSQDTLYCLALASWKEIGIFTS